MGVILGDPALRRLASLKLRGSVRKQLRRLRRPSGVLFMLVGGLLTLGWLSSLLFGRDVVGSGTADPSHLESWTKLGMLIFVLISGLSAFSVRGVYLPKNEIERLFAAPVSRADLIRYRMWVDASRSLFGALVLGLLTCRRMPEPLFGFFGAVIAVLTLGVLRQTVSLLFAGAQTRFGGWMRRRRLGPLRFLLGLLVWGVMMTLIFGERFTRRLFAGLEGVTDPTDLLELPIVRALLAPLTPWAKVMAATDLSTFLSWGGVCVVLWLALFELTARLGIDHREASLETSNDVAARLGRLGKGGPLSSATVSRRAAGRRVPWLFGRGPLGAVAWNKSAAILRKARGTMLIGVLIVTLVTVGVSYVFDQASDEEAGEVLTLLASSGLIALLGVMYLSGTLRFDFRSDIDRMEQIKAWPVGPTRLFVAHLLPEIALISTLITSALLVRTLVLGLFHPALLGIIAAIPFVLFAWVAVDNAVFLLAPVRYVPGQEGAMHHAGRAIVLLVLRGLLVGVTLGLVAAPAAALYALGPDALGLEEEALVGLAIGAGFVILLLVTAALAWVGGRLLRRFDVARDTA